MFIARKIFFYIFLGIYAVLCPLLILYAFGYIFNPLSQEISRTGLIYMSTTPSYADIYLEKSRYTAKTPASIDALNPGEYKITLKRKGYKPWSHLVSVEAGKAAAFEDILLIPDVWPANTLIEEEFTFLRSLGEADLFLLAGDERHGRLALYDYRNDKLFPVSPGEGSGPYLPVGSVFSARDGERCVIQGGPLWNRRWAYIHPAKGAFEIEDITGLMRGNPVDIGWGQNEEDGIFAIYKDHVDRLDIGAMAVIEKYLDGIRGCGVSDNVMYAVNDAGGIDTLTIGDKNIIPRDADAQLGRILKRSGSWKINASQKDILLFTGSRGRLVTDHKPYELVKSGLKGFRSSSDGKKLLFWTRRSIGLVSFETDDENVLFGTKALVKTCYSEGDNITDSSLTADGSHIIFSDDKGVHLLEIEPQGAPHVEFISKTRRNGPAFYSRYTGYIYYLDPKTGYFDSIELIPKGQLFFAPFSGEERAENKPG